MKIEKALNKDGTHCYLATGTCNDYKFIAEGDTRGEAFRSALILIRENGIERGRHLRAVT
jgi:hypothetical protein